MTIVVSPLQTFGAMLQKLRVRCGLHATLGDTPALNDILTEAHEYVYQQLDNGYPMTSNISLLANTPDYPFISSGSVPIARGDVKSVWLELATSTRIQLAQGITEANLAFTTMRAPPSLWDTKFINDVWNLQVWPTPDQAYTLYIDHNRVLSRFSDTADLPSVEYRLVLAYAVAMGKAHYGKADAATAGQTFKTMLSTAKYDQHENRRYLPNTSSEKAGPYVVSTVSGFVQIG